MRKQLILFKEPVYVGSELPDLIVREIGRQFDRRRSPALEYVVQRLADPVDIRCARPVHLSSPQCGLGLEPAHPVPRAPAIDFLDGEFPAGVSLMPHSF